MIQTLPFLFFSFLEKVYKHHLTTYSITRYQEDRAETPNSKQAITRRPKTKTKLTKRRGSEPATKETSIINKHRNKGD